MEKLMAIVSEDVIYADALYESIGNSHVIDYKTEVFYESDEYEFFRSVKDVDVLLISEKMFKEIGISNEKEYIILSDKKGCGGNRLFMYQSTDRIIDEICFKVRISNRDGKLENHSYKTYCVCAEKGGGGASTAALSLASVIGREKRVLFISLDPFIILPPDMGDEKNLSEMIYNVKVHGKNWTLSPDGKPVYYEGFDFITGVSAYEDINLFTKENMRDLFAGIAEEGRYQCVVFDIGNLPLCSSVVLEKSEKVFFLGNDDSLNRKIKFEHFKKIFGNEFEKKIISIAPEYDKKIAEGNLPLRQYRETSLYELMKKYYIAAQKNMAGSEREVREYTQDRINSDKSEKKQSVRRLLVSKQITGQR